MRYLIVLLLVWFSCYSAAAQNQAKDNLATKDEKNYILVTNKINTDFNYKMLDDFENSFADLIKENNSRELVFNPVNGKYHYYKFVATYKARGISKDSDAARPEQTFHNILIIKTDDYQKIVDGYHFVLEWGEKPLSYPLFRVKATDLTLQEGLSLKQLNLKRAMDNTDFDGDGKIKLSGR
ncbi:hypothetical protein [Sphingobacterium siyangense]|uniref:Uncharacterized protein n=1 Tax=Sphingobacterium siyangense TaxID=459529 RepID=A0A562MBI3_9SPHI|nr:hypothetical protein [Sphingobacterium siyangense]TWI17192.1 hypothetical protein IQ31_03928 [Sphingobacterium siyangense]